MDSSGRAIEQEPTPAVQQSAKRRSTGRRKHPPSQGPEENEENQSPNWSSSHTPDIHKEQQKSHYSSSGDQKTEENHPAIEEGEKFEKFYSDLFDKWSKVSRNSPLAAAEEGDWDKKRFRVFIQKSLTITKVEKLSPSTLCSWPFAFALTFILLHFVSRVFLCYRVSSFFLPQFAIPEYEGIAWATLIAVALKIARILLRIFFPIEYNFIYCHIKRRIYYPVRDLCTKMCMMKATKLQPTQALAERAYFKFEEIHKKMSEIERQCNDERLKTNMARARCYAMNTVGGEYIRENIPVMYFGPEFLELIDGIRAVLHEIRAAETSSSESGYQREGVSKFWSVDTYDTNIVH